MSSICQQPFIYNIPWVPYQPAEDGLTTHTIIRQKTTKFHSQTERFYRTVGPRTGLIYNAGMAE